MAIIPSTKYTGQIDTSDPTGYPLGKPQNVITTGDGTGTPLEKDWLADLWGYLQYKLSRVGITATGTPDKVGASQYMDADDVRLGTPGNLLVLPFDLDAAVWLDPLYDTTTQIALSRSGIISPDGTKLIIASGTYIWQWTLSLPYVISSATYDGDSTRINTTAFDNGPEEMAWRDDGTQLFVLGSLSGDVASYTCPTPWDIASATKDANELDTSTETTGNDPTGMCISYDGKKIYVVARLSNQIYEYTLSTAWDLSTGTYSTNSLNQLQETVPTSLAISKDGRLFWICGTAESIEEFVLSTPFDISTGTYNSKSLNLETLLPGTQTITKINVNHERTMMVVVDNGEAYLFSTSRVVGA